MYNDCPSCKHTSEHHEVDNSLTSNYMQCPECKLKYSNKRKPVWKKVAEYISNGGIVHKHYVLKTLKGWSTKAISSFPNAGKAGATITNYDFIHDPKHLLSMDRYLPS